jgi:hypothetical protein
MTKTVKQYLIIVVILSLAIALTIHFPLILRMLFTDGGREGIAVSADHHHSGITQSFMHTVVETVITFIVAFGMFIMNYFILKPTDRNVKMTVVRLMLAVGLTILLVWLLNQSLFSISKVFDTETAGRDRRSEFDLTNFYVAALVVGCVLIIRLVFQKQSIMLEFEELKRQTLQHQYDSLKNQISPHFLFNSLTALKVLVDEAPEKAQNYISSLSRALRYTLQSNDKQLVTLREEMDFMESYLFLIRIRYDTNLMINKQINEDLLLLNLPPLTIQTLVENAIKHNEISKRKPLIIDIATTEDDCLFVRNNIQVKLTEESGTGIGLSNLSKQFLMLTGKDIEIKKEPGIFTVIIPLITV